MAHKIWSGHWEGTVIFMESQYELCVQHTVCSLILLNRFLQIALKLLSTLLCNFAACNHIEIGATVVWQNPHEAMTSRCEDICQKTFRKNSEQAVGYKLSQT